MEDLRVTRGWKQRNMYDALNAAATELGEERNFRFDRVHIRRWIGGVAPRESTVLQIIALGWKVPVKVVAQKTEEQRTWRYQQRVNVEAAPTIAQHQQHTLAAPQHVLSVPPQSVAASSTPAATDPHPPLPYNSFPQQEDDDPTRRRTVILGLFGYAAGIPTATILDPAVRALDMLTHGSGEPVAEVFDAFDALIEQLGDQYSRTPPALTYSRVDGLLRSVQPLHRVKRPRHATHLNSMTGWLVAILSNALYDLSDTVASEAAALTALHFAIQSGDGRLLAFLHDRRAMRAENANNLPSALRSFQASVAAAPPGTAVRVRALAASARVHARLGDHDAARLALSQAESAYAKLPAGQIGDGSFAVSSIAVTDAHISTSELSGNTSRAVAAAQQTIAYYAGLPLAQRRPTRLALAHLRMAELQAIAAVPDIAVSHVTEALHTERLVLPVILRADRISAELSQRWPDQPAVEQLRERVRVAASLRHVSHA